MKQEVVVTDVSQCQKDISIEIPAEEVKKEFERDGMQVNVLKYSDGILKVDGFINHRFNLV